MLCLPLRIICVEFVAIPASQNAHSLDFASPKVRKYQVDHSFMSSYIFIHQLFYVRVILSYIYVKTISSVSV